MTKLIAILSVFAAVSAHALDLPINQLNQNNQLEAGGAKIPKTMTDNYDFEGIVGLSNCSGSLIQLEGVSDANPALILTNGHCLEGGFTAPGSFVYKKTSARNFTLLNSAAGSAGRVTASQIVYSTMTKTDMTIYKLTESYADIKARLGIRPLVLASQHPEGTEEIEIISGYWKRGYTCAIEGFVNELKEEGYIWSDSIRFSRPGCETIGGTSGSPITKAGTKIVIGVNNTGNESGGKCSMNNPCEIDKDGKLSYTKGLSYGQQTYWVYSCLTTTNEIDLAVPGCLLPH